MITKDLRIKHSGLIGINTKVPIQDSYSLSLVYTPGVGASCKAIVEDVKESFELTNRKNSLLVAMDATEEKALSCIPFVESAAYNHKCVRDIDAYPLVLKTKDVDELANILVNLVPNFAAYDLRLISDDIKPDLMNKLKGFELPIIWGEENVAGVTALFIQDKCTKQIKDFHIEENTIAENSLKLHKEFRGVIHTEPKFVINNQSIISKEENEQIAQEIFADSEKVFDYTAKGNLVGIVTEGSAVLGFGNIGPDAALPVMEGKAALFKSLGGIDAFPICLNTQKIDEFVNIVEKLTPVLGGINLEDIGAPMCFEIEQKLIEKTDIPIFHDDQHGAAIIVLAGFLNALKLTGKKLGEVKVVMSGAGAAAQAVAKLLLSQGVKNLILSDIDGVVYKDRAGMDKYLAQMAEKTNPNDERGTLKDIIKGADFLIGLSAAGIVSPEMIKSMNEKSVIFVLANPIPEIMPDVAKEAGAYIVATGRADFTNQINNSLAFPGVFRGALDVRASKINDEMKLAAANAIASLITEEELKPDYIIPNALDLRVCPNVAAVVAKVAVQTGVSRVK